jgi:uncharacterized protein YndB with AHSA1/START domain
MSRQAIVTLPADNQILVTREVAAPRHLVYRAWTEPDLIRRWWAADRGTMTVAEVDLRPGGTWRYAMIANGGFEVAFHGEYLEVIPGEKIISTEIFEGAPPPPDGQAAWAPAVTTVTFADAPAAGHGGSPGTTVTILVEHPAQESRDLHLKNGMEDGLQDALDLVEQAAAALA